MQIPTIREIVCTSAESSAIEEIHIYVKQGNSRSSVEVTFRSGVVYYYPALDNAILSKCMFADSIGSEFNKLVSGDENIRYVKLV